MNSDLLQRLHKNPDIAYFILRQLQEKWPQVNPKTNIAAAHGRVVHIPKAYSLPIRYWKSVETWRTWYAGNNNG